MSKARAWLAIWSGWTALALFFAASTSLTYRSTGRPGNWALTIERALSEWWLWAVLTPLVVWLARRFPLHGPGRVHRPTYLARLPVRTGGRTVFVDLGAVDWLEAADNYVRVHVRQREYLVRGTLALESQLDPDRFVRIHRSAIVPVDRVAEIRPTSHGDAELALRDGTRLSVSRTFRERLRIRQAVECPQHSENGNHRGTEAAEDAPRQGILSDLCASSGSFEFSAVNVWAD